VDLALATLQTDEDRIGQLLLLGWVGNTAEQARPTLEELRPGGIVFVDNARTVADAGRINAGLRTTAEQSGLLPLLIAVDHEGGTVQRIRDLPDLGSNAAFASRRPSNAQACERGLIHARQLRPVGFNMNLAPVLDVNNNPANPVIGSRSYGAAVSEVARLGSAYIRGLQAGGIAAVGKHFPGHGNTGVDSHLELPVLRHTVEALEDVELVPFRAAAEPSTQVAAIMSAHITFPAVDPSGAPATLSWPIMTGLLRHRLGFDGLVLTDDLAGMRAITDNFTPGQAAVAAIQAGVDMLIIAGGIGRQRESRDALLAGLRSGQVSRSRVEEAVRRVLTAKARFALPNDPGPADMSCA
jgi:beta-N-acetylhexosaminidase